MKQWSGILTPKRSERGLPQEADADPPHAPKRIGILIFQNSRGGDVDRRMRNMNRRLEGRLERRIERETFAERDGGKTRGKADLEKKIYRIL